ncbi:MAG: AAA family ATPase [Burkholderiales bacterium]
MNLAAPHHHYNPDWQSDDAIVGNFVARLDEYTFLRDELSRAPREGSVQHYLLVGLRGAGKTTLLKRLAVAIRRDVDLSDHLIALSFPEELYQVKNLSDFWWAACEALADELDRSNKFDESEMLHTARAQARKNGANTDPLSDAGYKCLMQTCAALGRRPVLLVDNLDMVFQRIDKTGRKLKDAHAPAYWALREALSTTTSPIVIGGSVRLSEPFTDYDKAFYDFFIPKRLGKLSIDEVRLVIEHLADAQGAPAVKQRLQERPSRVEALYELTGGNPRAIGLIFDLLRQTPDSRVVEDFERLMDITTPYYKARFEDLSEQAQVVIHALAVCRPEDGDDLRFGFTAAEIANHAGLPTGTVSAQLDIQEREGLVEKTAAHGRTQYRIAEQLFRLWLQMRGSRRIRENVLGLSRFLEAMFSVEELRAGLPEKNGISAMNESPFSFAVGKGISEPTAQDLIAQSQWQVQRCIGAARGALEDRDFAALRESLGKFLSESFDFPASVVSRHFVEDFLAPLLTHGERAKIVLNAMLSLSYAKCARPLLLALEAAVEGRSEMLSELEPEVQRAAQEMFLRLTGKLADKKQPLKRPGKRQNR